MNVEFLFLYKLRSGSSLVGEMFNQNIRAFYWFEPLSGIYQHLYGFSWGISNDIAFRFPNGTSRSASHLELDAISYHLNNIFTCKLHELPLEVLTDNFLTDPFMRHIVPMSATSYSQCLKSTTNRTFQSETVSAYACKKLLSRGCKSVDGISELSCYRKLHDTNTSKYDISILHEVFKSSKMFKTEDLQKHQLCMQSVMHKAYQCLPELIHNCKKAKLRATKVIRLQVESIKHVLMNDPDVKIIYYMRDPRAIIYSRLRTSGIKQKLVKEATELCSTMEKDFRSFKQLSFLFPNSMLMFRYEDLLSDRVNMTTKVYNFIEKELPESVLKFYEYALSAKKDGRGMETFRRNATYTSLQWKRKLSQKDLLTIETVCKNVLVDLHYPV